jgi:apolipoprotein D and lipocalin family protein
MTSSQLPRLLAPPALRGRGAGPLAAIVLAAAWAFGCSQDPPLDVAPNVDLSRFQGQWYEIAKLPRTTQADCYNTSAYYTLFSDGSMALINQCFLGSASGPLKSVTMGAQAPDPSTPAKLAVDVGGFYGDYWILEVGPSYDYAVVGHPSREYLWILSRTPTLADSTMSGVISRMQAEDFDTSALQYTPQSPEQTPHGPLGDVAPPVGYGCAVGPGRASKASLPLALGLLVLGALARRRSPPGMLRGLSRRG